MSSKQAAAWVAAFALLVIAAFRLIDTPQESDPSNEQAGPANSRAEVSAASSLRAKVVRVIDGDTIEVRIGDHVDRVRYIGVDTPETVKPNAPVQCFGKRASAFNHRMVEGETVRLVADRESRDRYGRRLSYVYAGVRFVNAELIRRGYARTLEIEPNTRFAERFARYEYEAKRTNKGLWSACDR